MALDVSVRDAQEFRKRTGREIMVALADLATKICPDHSRQTASCETCLPPLRLCVEHQFEVDVCDRCAGPRMRAEEFGALAWLIKRRDDPDLAYDPGAMGIIEAQTVVGEWFAASQIPEATAAEPDSAPESVNV